MRTNPLLACIFFLTTFLLAAEDQPLVFEAKPGPGAGKNIVLIAGDEEYRSEEAMVLLGKILSTRHGFNCTVLFPIDPADGTINPIILTNIPGMECLRRADLCILFVRFRELPDAQMKHFVDYVSSGKPLIALRTSTHAFAYNVNKQSPYAKYDWRSQEWPGGFGQQVLGETWVSHHGDHGKQSTRGVINPDQKNSPILRGVTDIWGPTDVYTVIHLPPDASVLVRGQVLSGMNPTDPSVEGPKNDPMMPLVWTRMHRWENGISSKILTATIGSAVDLQSEGLRRLLVNAAYWATGLEARVPPKADVRPIGKYEPSWFGFGKFRKGMKPADLKGLE